MQKRVKVEEVKGKIRVRKVIKINVIVTTSKIKRKRGKIVERVIRI